MERQDGFTLVELVVAMLIGTIIMLATFQSLDLFRANTTAQSRVVDANDQVRTLMERTVRELRMSAAVTHAAPQDLIYTVAEPAGTRTRRICVDGDRLYGFTSVTPAPAPSAATPCTSGAPLATLKSTSATSFSYDGDASSGTPQTVRNVGLTFGLDATSGTRAGSSRLQASASRRTGTLSLTDGDLEATCTSAGALLSLDVDLPGLDGLSVTYADDGGIAIGTPVTGGVLIPEGLTNVVATVTDAAGITSTIRQTVECG